MKKDRLRSCFEKSRLRSSLIFLVAYLLSSKHLQKPIQTWSPGISKIIGDFSRIFQHFQIGLLLILEIFQILILFSSRPPKILDIQWNWIILFPVEARLMCFLRYVIWSLSRTINGAHVEDLQPYSRSSGVFFWACYCSVLVFLFTAWSDLGHYTVHTE